MKKFENADVTAAINAFLESDKTIAASEFGSPSIGVGFTGVVEDYAYGEVSGPGTSVRTKDQGPQVIQVDGKNIVLAEVGKHSQALFMTFEGGARQLAMGALQQNPASTFTFEDQTELSCAKMTGKDWARLKGATIELVETHTDPTKPVTRTQNGQQVNRPSRVYKFVVYGAASADAGDSAKAAKK